MATGDPNTYNFIQLVRKGLSDEIKIVLTEKLVREQLAEYEIELRKVIKPIVEGLIFKGMGNRKDMLQLREELHVYLHWQDDPKNPVEKEI